MEETPYKLWKCHSSSYQHLIVWGCLAKAEASKPNKQVKINPSTIDCIFIGYINNSSTYRFLIHKSEILNVHEGTIIESKNASFFENAFPYKDNVNASSNQRTYETINDTSNEEELTCCKRARTSTSFGPNFLTHMVENDSKTFDEIMSIPKAFYWKKAINSEINYIMQNHTQELIDLPHENKPLGYKWIFKNRIVH